MIVASIILPWPPRALSPNGRPAHWAVRNKAKKAQRDIADALAREAGLHKAKVPDGASVNVTLTACPKPRGPYPDDDNLIASLKAARDAIAAVMGVDDARFRMQPVLRGERCRDGAVRVEFEVVA